MHSRTLSILLKLHDISENDPSQEMFLTQNIFFLGGTIPPPKKKYGSIFQRIVPYKKIFVQAVTGRELFPTRKKKTGSTLERTVPQRNKSFQAVSCKELFPTKETLSRQYPITSTFL